MLFFDHFEPDITDFVKNLYREVTPFKNQDLGECAQAEHEQGLYRLSTSKHKLSTSKHEQIWEIFDLGHFNPEITDFVKNS